MSRNLQTIVISLSVACGIGIATGIAQTRLPEMPSFVFSIAGWILFGANLAWCKRRGLFCHGEKNKI